MVHHISKYSIETLISSLEFARSYELICMMHRILFLLVMDLNIFAVTKRYLQMESGILNSCVKFCCMLTQCSYCYFDSWGLKKRMKTYLHQTNESWQKERWRDKDIKYQKWFQSKENCFTGSEIPIAGFEYNTIVFWVHFSIAKHIQK